MDHQRQNNRRDSSPSIDLLNGLGESNSIYGILASELFTLQKYDLSCRVKVGGFKRAGGFSDVYDGILELDGGGPTLLFGSPGVRPIKVAVKRLRFLVGMHDEIKKVKIVKTVVRELKIWTRLKHKNVLLCEGFTVHENVLCFVSEWMENGNVIEYLSKNPDVDRELLVQGVASGLQYLHVQEVVHSDLKGDNVLINKMGEAILCDFGVSRILVENGTLAGTSTLKGCYRWMAIELINSAEAEQGDGNRQLYTKESDVWAFGMITYFIITGKLPYYDRRGDAKIILAITSGLKPDSPPQDEQRLPRFGFLWKICQQCWERSPADRPTIANILDRLANVPVNVPNRVDRVELSMIHNFKIHTDVVRCAVFSPVDTRRLATSSNDMSICIWELSQEGRAVTLRHRLTSHRKHVKSIAWSSGGLFLVSGSYDRSIRKWNTSTGGCQLVIESPQDVSAVTISPDDRYIAFGTSNGSLCVSDASSGVRFIGPLRGHTKPTSAVSYSPNGRHFISASEDTSIIVWDSDTGAILFGPIAAHSNWIEALSYHPLGFTFVTCAGSEITIWNGSTFEAIHKNLNTPGGRVTSVQYSPDGRFVLSTSLDGTLRAWDAERGRIVGEPAANGKKIRTAGFSPDGKLVACGYNSGDVRIWVFHESTGT